MGVLIIIAIFVAIIIIRNKKNSAKKEEFTSEENTVSGVGNSESTETTEGVKLLELLEKSTAKMKEHLSSGGFINVSKEEDIETCKRYIQAVDNCMRPLFSEEYAVIESKALIETFNDDQCQSDQCLNYLIDACNKVIKDPTYQNQMDMYAFFITWERAFGIIQFEHATDEEQDMIHVLVFGRIKCFEDYLNLPSTKQKMHML